MMFCKNDVLKVSQNSEESTCWSLVFKKQRAVAWLKKGPDIDVLLWVFEEFLRMAAY